MARRFVITAENNPQIFRDIAYKDGATYYSFDFAPWADDNATVTSVTWTSKAGSATISGTALASNVATGLVTFGSAGGNLIQLKAATTSNGTYIVYLDVEAKDPVVGRINDYGIVP